MGLEQISCYAGFYASVVVDTTTLPDIRSGSTVPSGARFTVRGSNFYLWPDEIVLGYNQARVVDTQMPSAGIFRLVSKTNHELVFESTGTYDYSTGHVFNVFGTPFDPRRRVLTYTT